MFRAEVAAVVTDPDVETEVGDERKIDRSGHRIRCPLCGWQPRKDDLWACKCGHLWNTFEHGRRLPDVSVSVDCHGLPVMSPVVGAFGLVRVLIRRRRAHDSRRFLALH